MTIRRRGVALQGRDAHSELKIENEVVEEPAYLFILLYIYLDVIALTKTSKMQRCQKSH